jgi:hypothetical protein
VSDPLESSRLRLNRASEHLDALKAEIEQFIGRNPYRTPIDLDSEAEWQLMYWRVLDEPDRRWGVIVGEVAHNLRSALDHATWQAACIHLEREPTEEEARRIDFPITNAPRDFARLSVRDFLGDDAIAAIELAQPYRGGERAQLLNTLTWLSNVDKHRSLQAAFVALQTGDITLHFRSNDDAGALLDYEILAASEEPLVEDTPFARLRFEMKGPNPKVHMEGQAPVYVAFGDADRWVAFNTLTAMWFRVGHALSLLEPVLRP